MLFGVLAVNRYYGYYQTWSAMIADLSDQGVGAASQVPDTNLTSGSRSGTLDGSRPRLEAAQQQGYLLRLSVTGQRSRITRLVYVYLPPQYFQPAYRAYRFPAIELIHGQPGQPQDWITVMGVTQAFDRLLADKLAQPAVLVMPDANGGQRISLQCLDQVGGPQDLTYLAVDLPAQIARMVRVLPPGAAWGVAGYSEGGFCAANMALRYPHRYGFAGVLSGYFTPDRNQLTGSGRPVSPFGGNRRLQEQNTPLAEIQKLPAAADIPQFWLGAGAADRQAVADTEVFWRDLRLRQDDVPLTLTPGGGHTMTTWRAQIPLLLTWMTRSLARAAQREAVAGPGTTTATAAHRPATRQPDRTRHRPAPGPASRTTVRSVKIKNLSRTVRGFTSASTTPAVGRATLPPPAPPRSPPRSWHSHATWRRAGSAGVPACRSPPLNGNPCDLPGPGGGADT
jgi:enterochelin esterase-like enzyme